MSIREEFKFQIGVIVKFVIDAEGYGPRMMVTSRHYEECPGGIQIHYHVRPFIDSRDKPFGQSIMVNEIELREQTALERAWNNQLVLKSKAELFKMKETLDLIIKEHGLDKIEGIISDNDGNN